MPNPLLPVVVAALGVSPGTMLSQSALMTLKEIGFIRLLVILKYLIFMPPSSRGLGHLPFTEATGIRIPLGVLLYKFFKHLNGE